MGYNGRAVSDANVVVSPYTVALYLLSEIRAIMTLIDMEFMAPSRLRRSSKPIIKNGFTWIKTRTVTLHVTKELTSKDIQKHLFTPYLSTRDPAIT